MSKIVCVKTFTNRPEANLAKTVLEVNGIQASVSADDAGGVPAFAKLFVLEEHVDQALMVLEKQGSVDE